MKLWIDGVLRDIDRARIAPNDRGFLLADGLFETMRAFGGEVLHFDAHYQRLCEGLAVVGLSTGWTADLLRDACRELLAANDLTDASMRLTVTRGTGPRGLLPPDDAVPTVMLTAFGLPHEPHQLPPATLAVSDVRRNEGSPLSRIKSLGYLDNILALGKARAAGFDDALLLNNAGRACCASAANLFALTGKRLVTPPVTDGVLPGITRARLMDAAAAQGFQAAEGSLTVDQLKQADALYLTNSLIGIRPVAALDDHRFEALSCPVQLD